jgi:hypothetical protein
VSAANKETTQSTRSGKKAVLTEQWIHLECIYLETKLDSSQKDVTRLDLSRKQTGFIYRVSLAKCDFRPNSSK